ncbi:MAG: GTP-binding protein [Ectothiorhodospiraceae bacterium]|nr:GTP-binding protein [Ectothiorhodospiraceae bacterium]
MPDTRIPVTVVTGFLGSGKSTLLNQLLRQPGLDGVAVIINEFGSVSVDHHMVEKIDDNIVLIDSGCLCCTVHGDLVRSLKDLFMRALRREIKGLRRVVIETTGLADVAPVIHTLLSDFFIEARFVLDGVVTTVDACHIDEQLAGNMEAVKQVTMADVLLVTKLDLAGEDALAGLATRLRALNPGADVLPCMHGRMPAGRILALGAYRASAKAPEVEQWLRAEQDVSGHHDHSHPHDPDRHDANVHAFSVHINGPVEWAAVAEAFDLLQSAYGERLLRIKGLLRVRGQELPQLTHAVHHQLYPTVPLERVPEPALLGRLVFIVRGLAKADIVKLLHIGLPVE